MNEQFLNEEFSRRLTKARKIGEFYVDNHKWWKRYPLVSNVSVHAVTDTDICCNVTLYHEAEPTEVDDIVREDFSLPLLLLSLVDEDGWRQAVKDLLKERSLL